MLYSKPVVFSPSVDASNCEDSVPGYTVELVLGIAAGVLFVAFHSVVVVAAAAATTACFACSSVCFDEAARNHINDNTRYMNRNGNKNSLKISNSKNQFALLPYGSHT